MTGAAKPGQPAADGCQWPDGPPPGTPAGELREHIEADHAAVRAAAATWRAQAQRLRAAIAGQPPLSAARDRWAADVLDGCAEDIESLQGRSAVTGRPSDEDLLIECDALLSLARYREASALTGQTIRDIDALLRVLRPRTDEITRSRRT